MASNVPTRRISGRFYRAVRVDRIEAVLNPPGADSAGRYHRHGQPALYITTEPDWAVIALGGYMAEDGLPRAVVPLEISAAAVFDQRDEAACRALGIDPDHSDVRWRLALEKGEEPLSWKASDAARAAGTDGIIDRSRGIVGGWHVALFCWNEKDEPFVKIVGDPILADYYAARARWAHPPGWQFPAFEIKNS